MLHNFIIYYNKVLVSIISYTYIYLYYYTITQMYRIEVQHIIGILFQKLIL